VYKANKAKQNNSMHWIINYHPTFLIPGAARAAQPTYQHRYSTRLSYSCKQQNTLD
jgi:hypothetical protein